MRGSSASRLLLLSVILLILFGGVSASAQLADRMEDLLQQRQVEEAFWGVAIYDLGRDSLLYRRNLERGFLPASNQKLLTTATALDRLGGSYRYETTLHFNGTALDSLMSGDLILQGSGDPTFGSTEFRRDDPLREWAERLAEMGVRRIEGRLIGDDEAFDDQRYPDGWNVNYLTQQRGRQMGVSASGLSYGDNVVPVTVQATQPGQPPHVETAPNGVVDYDNQATTSSRWRGSTLRIDRVFSTNQIELTGSVARSYQGTLSVPVSDPTAFTLRIFEQRLREAGIETGLTLEDVDDVDEPLDRGAPLFVELSPPLAEIVSVVNKRSNNFYAEQLFRTYGWNGSARGAAQRTESFLRRAGIAARRLQVSDGSGLSRKNLVTPRALMELLVHMDDHPAREAFLSSLPRGGERNTTLSYRLSQAPVRAKTGSLQFVRALSGYVQRPDDSRVVFVLFANNYTGPSYQISDTMDDVVELLAAPPS